MLEQIYQAICWKSVVYPCALDSSDEMEAGPSGIKSEGKTEVAKNDLKSEDLKKVVKSEDDIQMISIDDSDSDVQMLDSPPAVQQHNGPSDSDDDIVITFVKS